MNNNPPVSNSSGVVLATGWGRGSSSAAKLSRVRTQDELERIVARANTSSSPMLARGLGRSYGDAAQCQGGTLLDTTALEQVIEPDFTGGLVRVEAGISIDKLLRFIVPHGWFVPVTPGTRQVTIGGAIAADVHGKNHHQDGTFGKYVDQLTLVTAKERIVVSPTQRPEIFWATVAGMGLTGVIAEATIRLHPIETASMLVDTDRTQDLEETMAQLSVHDDRYRYSVAWIDCSARGRHLGRSILTRGDHAQISDIADRHRQHALDYRPKRTLKVPKGLPFNLVYSGAVAAANEFYYRKAPKHRVGELQSIASFFYPLDAIENWNQLYGPRGFTQYQFVVPFGAEQVIHKIIERLHASHLIPSLGVLKRFGNKDLAPLSFPMPGWTLALDFALNKVSIGPVLDEIDELVAAAGGRIYLAKDGRLRPEIFRAMYPRLDAWNMTRKHLDPKGIFASDLSRRLGVTDL